MATTGGPFDLGVVPVDVFRDAPTRTQFVPGPTLGVARVGSGRPLGGSQARHQHAGIAPSRRCLRRNPSPRYPQSATGTLLAGIYERLGIAEEMKAKTKAQPGPS